MAQSENHATLQKSLSPAQVWALALGSIVGWGCFVLPGDSFLPNSGPMAAISGFIIGAILLSFVAITYSYMIEYTPVAGGEYAYAYVGYGSTAAFICGWALVLGYISIIAINISALALLFRFLLPGFFEVGELYNIAGWHIYAGEVALMLTAIVFFGALNYVGVSFAGTFQVILAFMLTFGILALFFGTISLETASLSNMQPLFAEHRAPLMSILSIVAISPFLFVGFDTVPQAAEEFSFEPKKSRNIMLAAIIWGAILYTLVTFSVAVAIPYPELLAKMADLKAQGLTAWATGEVSKMAFGPAGAIVLACAVLGAVCTGINGFYVATTRLLLSMSRGHILPAWFGEIHPKYKTPHKAIIFTILFVMITPFFGRAVVGWIVDMSSVGTAIAYLFTCLAARKVIMGTPNIPNAGGRIFCTMVGSITSIICIGLLIIPGSPAFIAFAPRIVLVGWVVLGVIFYYSAKPHWASMSDADLKRQILGSESIPTFFR